MRHPPACFSLLLSCLALPFAQTAYGQPYNEHNGVTPLIGAVNIEGNQETDRTAFAAAIENFIGRKASPDVLQQLANAVSEAAKSKGYAYANVSIPSQTVTNGVVTLRLEAGSIDEVRILGSHNQHLRNLLDQITGSNTDRESHDSIILQARDIPGVTITDSRLIKEDGRGILLVTVEDKRVYGSVAFDNWGSRAFGPVRMRPNISFTGLLDDSDRLTFQATATLAQPDELAYVSAQYSIAPGYSGLTLGTTVGMGSTKPGNIPSDISLEGSSLYISSYASYPLKRSSNSSLWLNAEAAYIQLDQTVFDEAVQKDRAMTLSLGISGYQKIASGGLNWSISATQGLDLFGTTRPGDRYISRFDGSGVFNKVNLSLNWFGNLDRNFSLRLAANGQFASRGLLASQELGLGGPFIGRGYDFFEKSGDDGVMGLVELRRKLTIPCSAIKWAHAYLFVDGGYVSNKHPQLADGALASAGGGVRAGVGHIELGLEGAQPLTGHRYAAKDSSTQINAILGYSF